MRPSTYDRLAAFKHFSAAPTLVLSVAMLGSFMGPMLFSLHRDQEATWIAVSWIALVLFSVEFATRLALAQRKRQFLVNNILDLSIITFAVTGLLTRQHGDVVVLAACALLLILEIGKDVKHLSRARNFPYAIAVVLLAILVCGSLEYHFESPSKGSNVTTPADGVWWAITTLTTVGYGDKYPTTNAGKIIASVLMIIGLAFTGVLSAVFTSLILRKDEAQAAAEAKEFEERVERAVRAQIAPLLEKIGESNRS